MPKREIGDWLWVRETFCIVDGTEFGGDKWIDYKATPRYSESHPVGWDNDPENTDVLKWRPSIHMPRHASRILLEATNVRVERLQEISAEDMIVEGCESGSYGAYYPVENYARLWQSMTKAHGI